MMQPLRPRGGLLALVLLLAALPAGAAERSVILLYRFESTTPAAPAPVPPMVALLVQDELQKGGKYTVSIREPASPIFRRAESEQPSADPTQLHQALRVARSIGARFVVQGVVTAYEAPQEKSSGKITFKVTVAATETEVSRDVFVTAEIKVAGRAPAAGVKVLGPAARAVATAIEAEAIPALAHATPADRVQAAERAGARGQEAAAHGATGQAVEDLQRAAQLTPDDAAAHVALGEALVKQGLTASALLEFQDALALAEMPAEAGRQTAGKGEGGTAAGTGPTLGTTDHGSQALRLRLVRALGERGLWDEAAAEARRGLEREPGSEPLRLALAEAAIRAGDGAGALAALRPLHSARAPRDAEWNLLAEAYALTGDAPRWLDALVRGTVAGASEEGQYAAVVRRLDLAFRSLTDEAAEAERRILAGQLPPATFGAAAARRAAQARIVAEYLSRLAFPQDGAAAHEARQGAWSGLARAAERAGRFANGGTYEDLAAARGERLRALAQLEGAHSQ